MSERPLELRADLHEQAAFRPLADALSPLVALIQGEKLVYVNPAGCALLGLTREEAVGRDFWEFALAEDPRFLQRGSSKLTGARARSPIWRTLFEKLGRDVRGISREALRLLVGHEWRGNIRELSNAIERAVIFAAGAELAPADLPESFCGVTPREVEYPPELELATREFERAHILKVIEQCGGNKRKAAKVLGIGKTSLYRKLGEPATDTAEEPAS